MSYTKTLLAVLKEKKDRKETFTKNMWRKVSVSSKEKGLERELKPDQCREEFYSLRRVYRNFTAQKGKTGNKRPKPFVHEEDMFQLLHDNPSFNPPVLKSSLGTNDVNNNNSSRIDNNSPSTCTQDAEGELRKAPKRKAMSFWIT